jgi:hypothetical protein
MRFPGPVLPPGAVDATEARACDEQRGERRCASVSEGRERKKEEKKKTKNSDVGLVSLLVEEK